MNKPVLVAIGFLINALLGPLCMASMMQAMESAPVAEAAQHHHHAQTDCPNCENDTQPSSCAGHCIAQAKQVSPSSAMALPPQKGSVMFLCHTEECDTAEPEQLAQSPVFSPPFLIAVASTVLRL